MSPQKNKAKPLNRKTILLALSGSIALYKSCDLLRNLKEAGAEVHCVMTAGAQKFISALTFQALSGHPVHTDPFDQNGDWAVLHTTLADKADLILVSPASANLIARMAGGMANDLVTSVVLASRAKVLLVPAMNDHMYTHPITQDNLKRLKQIGYQVVEPIEGELVCGRHSVGHIAENETIIKKVITVLK
ncbi:MAG: hypothetical protein COV74_07815 [Candidatus Omnitrophica bacterium CG11_big_fil_rev_8_21_14_0_20_45_26]|uniref:Flavoprotein domain-containing protein n=1 Tax=Candidatus Abzuiibacterium crystallinum TaxID=1974748 RepID=A0A2H0LML6_9BACT|nr:MAG: hypothetical protein COV74_07815 [Candidatus Omnitrophica bacterium CG11_big_fil_rev_8_21_14_0_20_45_26]PIW65131.1 MAG: hypothetical protein COW12_02850 [Candidatus Omnitrophica bacterium CG12_big_fil_rev_8_21_14_0_65_45_16]